MTSAESEALEYYVSEAKTALDHGEAGLVPLIDAMAREAVTIGAASLIAARHPVEVEPSFDAVAYRVRTAAVLLDYLAHHEFARQIPEAVSDLKAIARNIAADIESVVAAYEAKP